MTRIIHYTQRTLEDPPPGAEQGISLNADAYGYGHDDTATDFLNKSANSAKDIGKRLEQRFDVPRNYTGWIMIDIERCAEPSHLAKWLNASNDHMIPTEGPSYHVDDFVRRINDCIFATRRKWPMARVGLYGPVASGAMPSTEDYLGFARLGDSMRISSSINHFNVLAAFHPVLYPRFAPGENGRSDPEFFYWWTRHHIRMAKQILIAAGLYYTEIGPITAAHVYNGGSDHHHSEFLAHDGGIDCIGAMMNACKAEGCSLGVWTGDRSEATDRLVEVIQERGVTK